MRKATITLNNTGNIEFIVSSAVNHGVPEVSGYFMSIARVFDYFEEYFGLPVVTDVRESDVDVTIYEDGDPKPRLGASRRGEGHASLRRHERPTACVFLEKKPRVRPWLCDSRGLPF